MKQPALFLLLVLSLRGLAQSKNGYGEFEFSYGAYVKNACEHYKPSCHSYYKGMWVNGKPHGLGNIDIIGFKFRADKNVEEIIDVGKVVGHFLNGRLTGHGTFRCYICGTKYEGEFIDGEFNGRGKYTTSENHVYEGDFADNKFNGNGVYYWTNGNVYNGAWVDDKMNGYGVFKYYDGDVYMGNFKDDFRDGVGILMQKSGSVKRQTYSNGVLINEQIQ